MPRKTTKIPTRSSRVEYLLAILNRNYSPEKTRDDYEYILKGFTYDRDLIDKTLEEWEKKLHDNGAPISI